jgi:hypothetical protein
MKTDPRERHVASFFRSVEDRGVPGRGACGGRVVTCLRLAVTMRLMMGWFR